MRKVDIIAIILLVITITLSVGCDIDSPKSQGSENISDVTSVESQVVGDKVSEMFSLSGCNNDTDVAAIKYIGYSIEENGLKDTLADVATDFVKYYDDIKYCRLDGDETYLLIPKYENSVVTIYSVDSDGNRINEDADFSETAKAVVFTCNVSDIIPNIEVTVEYTDENGEKESISFNPSISLMDGSVCDFEKVFEF